tara:strand:+ start:10829 stop:11521 length:693 start_codon:yes stop_codon:yes gene_type:complete
METSVKSKLWYLKQVKLFSDLSDAEMTEMEKMTRMEAFKKRQPIYLPGDPGDFVYLLKTGRVKISKIGDDGKELTLVILEAGEIFGELEMFEEVPRDTIAEALDDAHICMIRREDFERLLKNQPQCSFKLTKLIGLRMKQIENRIEDLVFRDAPARLAQLLINLSTSFGSDTTNGRTITTKMTHQELANLIGTTRETVSLTLGQFRQSGLIIMAKRQITILDLAGLQQLI